MTDKPKFNVLLMGQIGTGKTYSSRTLITENLVDELFILSVEPGIHTIMGDMPKDRVHWKYVEPASTDWDTLIQAAELTNKYGAEQLQKMQWPQKQEYQQFLEVYRALSDFTCDRTGENFGPVDSWGPNRALVVDGLSGLSQMALQLVVGAKPIKSQPEWGMAQSNLMNLLNKLVYSTKCTFILNAHVTRQKDEVSGGTFVTLDAIGKAIAPDIPKPFDEVIFAWKDGSKFYWSTERDQTDLKARILPHGDKLPPNFSQLYEAYEKLSKEAENG